MSKKILLKVTVLVLVTLPSFASEGCSQIEDALKTANQNAGDGGTSLFGGRKKAEPASAMPSHDADDSGACGAAVPVMCSDGTCCQTNTTCCGDGLCATDCTQKCPSDAPVDCLDGTCCAMKCCPNGGCDTCDAPDSTPTGSTSGDIDAGGPG